MEITISVSGIGISDANLKKLFIDFGKVEDSEGRNTSGTGLGLSICKQVIEKMGGTVNVRSEVGRGTDFVINLKTKCKISEVEAEKEDEIVDLEESQQIEDLNCGFEVIRH